MTSTMLPLVLVLLVLGVVRCEDELDFVLVVYRHGDRTPVDSYPTDPYKDPSQWPVGFGQLTPEGKRMHYALGQFLRERYGHFIGDKYSEDLLYVRSTDVDRTLMSAQSNLAGFFPPEKDQQWNPSLNWQPIPVHTMPQEQDNLLSSHADCPRIEEAKNEVLTSPEVKALNEKYAWLYSYVSEKTQANVTDMIHVDYIFDTLLIETIYNKTLPEWTKKVFPEPMRYLRDLSFTVSTWTEELKRLRAGPLIADIVNILNKVKEGDYQRKMHMYSGHDTTLSSLLNALGMFSPPIAPPYASCVMVESYKNGEIKFFYRNDTTREPYELHVPSCPGKCLLHKFQSATQHLVSNDWHKECRLANNEDMIMGFINKATFVVCVLLAVGLVGAVILAMVRRRRDQANHVYQHIHGEP